jgi:hypothetical protein
LNRTPLLSLGGRIYCWSPDGIECGSPKIAITPFAITLELGLQGISIKAEAKEAHDLKPLELSPADC